MLDRIAPRAALAVLLLWAAGPSPARADSVDQQRLQQALNLGQSKGTGSIAVYVDGRLAGSAGQQTKRYDLKSSTKSFGALLLCLALDDHKVTLASKGADFVPNFGQPSTALAGSVTVKELATHTAGFDKAGGFVPIKYKPGTAFAYSDGGANWLADVLTSAYHQDMAALFRSRIGSKLNISIGWRSNQYRPPTLNGVPRREFGSGITASVEAMGRVGVMLQHGGSGIISSGCVRSLGQTATRGLPVKTSFTPGASKHYGLLWWNNNDGAMSGVPRDAFWSWGLGDSFILVIPSKGLVVARAGRSWQGGWKADYRVLAPFFQAVSGAVR
jgi:CubicO group peptidase (beta-lactamase class C family)